MSKFKYLKIEQSKGIAKPKGDVNSELLYQLKRIADALEEANKK